MLELKSPVRASELILPIVKRGYPGCRQESRTRIPAARRRDVRKTGQFGQECGDDLDLDGQADDDLGAALVLLNESGYFHVFALKVEGTGERVQDFDRDHGLEISLGGDIGQPENWFLPWNVATSVVGGNRIW